jgi:hypothetical protein
MNDSILIEALLAEDEQALPHEQRVIRAQAIAKLSQLFTDDDWHAIATTVSQAIAHDIRQLGRQAAEQTVVR